VWRFRARELLETGKVVPVIDRTFPLSQTADAIRYLETGRARGKVVSVASDAGRVGSSGEAPYSACKGGLIALTKTLAREMASKNIQLNVVCPGLTETHMLEQFMQGAGNPEKLREAYRRAIPLGRLGKPEDLPGAILFFASDDADFITGQVLSVSGGLTMHG